MLQVASVLFWMFHVFHTHVARGCSKCFIYFQSYVAFILQVFMLFGRGRAGAGGRGTRRAGRPTDGGARVRRTEVLGAADGVAAGRGALGACSSSAAHPSSRVSHARRVGERGESQGKGWRVQRRRLGERRRGWATRVSRRARVCPDIRALAMYKL